MAAVIERERKYEIDAAGIVPRLDGTAGVRSQEDPVEHVLHSTYFDTSDFRLLRAGITLRRRTGGDAGWQLKLPIDAEAREEIQLPLRSDGERVPGRLKRLVRA